MSNERLVQIIETLAGQLSMTLAKAKTIHPVQYPHILAESVNDDAVMKMFDTIASLERKMFRIDLTKAYDDIPSPFASISRHQDFDLHVAENVNIEQDTSWTDDEPVGFNWTLLKNIASLSKAPIGVGMLIGDVKFNEVKFSDIDGECYDIVDVTLDWTPMVKEITGVDLTTGRLAGIVAEEMQEHVSDVAIYTEQSFVDEFRSRATDVIMNKGGQEVYDKLLAFFEIEDMSDKPMVDILDVCHKRYVKWKETGEFDKGDEFPDDEYDGDDIDDCEYDDDDFHEDTEDYETPYDDEEVDETDTGVPTIYHSHNFDEFKVLTKDIVNFANACSRVYNLTLENGFDVDVDKVAQELGRYYPEFGNHFAAHMAIMYNRIRAITKENLRDSVLFNTTFNVSKFERNLVTLIVNNYVVTKWIATFRSFDVQEFIDNLMNAFAMLTDVQYNTDEIVSLINTLVYAKLIRDDSKLFNVLKSAIPSRLHDYIFDIVKFNYEKAKELLGDEIACVLDDEYILLRGSNENEIFVVYANRKPEHSVVLLTEENPHGRTIETNWVGALMSSPFNGDSFILEIQNEEIERSKARAINENVASFMQDYFYRFAPQADNVRDEIIEELERGGSDNNDVSEVIHTHLQGQKQQYSGNEYDLAYSFIMASVVIKRMTDIVYGDYRLSSIKQDEADESIAVLFTANIMPAMVYFVLRTSPIIQAILKVSGFNVEENATVVDNLGRLSLSITQYLVSHGLMKPTHDMIELVDMIVDAFGIYLLDGLKLVYGNDVTYIDDRINHKLVNWVSNNVYLGKMFDPATELKSTDTKEYESLVKILENPDALLSFISLYENKLTTELKPGKLYKVNTSKGDVCLVYNDIRNAYTVLYKDDAYTCLERVRTKYKPTSVMTLIKHLVYGEKNK